jgi:hypothetical protein
MDTTRNVEEFFKNVQADCKKMNNYTTDWQQVRIQAAIAAMQGMLSNDCSVQSVMDMSEKVHRLPSDILATMAVSQADALIEELKGE